MALEIYIRKFLKDVNFVIPLLSVTFSSSKVFFYQEGRKGTSKTLSMLPSTKCKTLKITTWNDILARSGSYGQLLCF